MDRRSLLIRSSAIAIGVLPLIATAATAVVGQTAPAFTLLDTSGKPLRLVGFAGKTVVLEWNNPRTLGLYASFAERMVVSWFQGVTPRTAKQRIAQSD